MRKGLLLFLLTFATLLASAQGITLESGRFQKGDNPAWSGAFFDDSAWPLLVLDKDWNEQGVSNPHAFGWYRLHLTVPSAFKKTLPFPGAALLDLGSIDDCDETWFNGVKVGKTGTFPEDPEGYRTRFDTPRRYVVPVDLIRWDRDNVIAVRVYNGDDPGGFYEAPAQLVAPRLADVVQLVIEAQGDGCKLVFNSAVKTQGSLLVECQDILTEESDAPKTLKVKMNPGKPTMFAFPVEGRKRLSFTYTDANSRETLTGSFCSRYILTPPAPATPRYNGPLVYGVRPGSPVIFRLAFSGEKPTKYAVEGLPEGVVLDPDKGVLSGCCEKAGDYPLVFTATNSKGTARACFSLKVGEKIALTPPMGWNSWNCWGLSVSQEKVMASAAAFINRGLADYGYSYINLDDGWEARERTPEGYIDANEKFPDMKGLADWLHSNGLKFGIYSGPGARTCGGYPASLNHEEQDAEVWNSWGVDYLKYDWCSYEEVYQAQGDHSISAYVRPYVKMRDYLRKQPRDIFYSLSPIGGSESWTWGLAVDANSWRTTPDIGDTWESLSVTGFELQPDLYPYSGPGHWNDPDMLVVGKVGWSNNLRDSQLTPDEQYTHISLWSLLAANMLIGCDLAQMDDFTFNLLCNNEVNAVNQDILGHQAHRDVMEDGIQIWSRDLYDGSHAVGIFNLNDRPRSVMLLAELQKMGLAAQGARDLWRQKDIPTASSYVIPPHGVLYVKVK